MNSPTIVTLILLLVRGHLATNPANHPAAERIWNGQNAAAHSAPWMVALHLLAQRPPQHCGGSIIAPTWVLTAAHCVTPAILSASQMQILAGRHNMAATESSEQRRNVLAANVHLHPQFQPRPLANDVALVRVSPGFVYNAQVRAIALPAANLVHTGNARLHGWGMTENRVVPAILQTVQLPLLTHAQCLQLVSAATLQRTQLCTGREAGACHADSGGPLSQNGQIVGVVAWGACPGGPSGFERVSLFTGWIGAVMRG